MAKPGARSKPANRRGPAIALVMAALIAGALLWFRAPIAGYAHAGTAYGARVACSCRYAGGRSLEDCEKDKLAGMELVRLREDESEKSVTATFPLVASETARWKEGYGCVLDPWEG
jgi:hypothetical protein